MFCALFPLALVKADEIRPVGTVIIAMPKITISKYFTRGVIGKHLQPTVVNVTIAHQKESIIEPKRLAAHLFKEINSYS